MNSLYTLALRQSSSLSSDLQHLASLSSQNQTPPSTSPIHSRIQSTLHQLEQTVDDYDHMANREIVQQIREKAMARVDRFKRDCDQYKLEYNRIQVPSSLSMDVGCRKVLLLTGAPSLAQKSAADRSELLAASSSSSSAVSASSSPATATVQQRTTSTRYTPNSPWVPSPSAYPANSSSPSPREPPSYGYGYDPRTNAALSEHDFLSSTSQTLDAYLSQGQAVLSNLASQRDVLKGTQRRLRSAANTLGLSRNTIAFVERRTKEDWYILLAGGMVTLLSFYMILKYFG